MNDERVSDWWFTLEATASALLHERGPTRRGFSCPLRFIVKPSFEPWRAYEIHVPTSSPTDDCLGFVIAWDHPADHVELDRLIRDNPIVRLRRYASLKPSLRRTEVRLSRTGVAGTLDAIDELVLPVAVSSPALGCDGTSFELIIGRGFVESRFRWWEAPPDEWKGLAEVGDELISAIERVAKEAG